MARFRRRPASDDPIGNDCYLAGAGSADSDFDGDPRSHSNWNSDDHTDANEYTQFDIHTYLITDDGSHSNSDGNADE
ncbi:MAG: hypothetical protein MAG451_01126 [Anaerolineales bacterium]|nr:hypothetical protein [Anaerolineales bacterium]